MPFEPVSGGFKVEMLATIYGRPMVNVLGAISGTPVDQAALDAACEAYANSWVTNMAGFAESPYVYKGCRITDLSTSTGIQSFEPRDVAGAGSSDHNLPPSLAACVSLYTAVRSRRSRGRCFWPIIRQAGIVEANTTQLSDTFRNGLATNFAAFLADAAATDIPLAVCSRSAGVAYLVTQIAIDHRVDHQRRRDG